MLRRKYLLCSFILVFFLSFSQKKTTSFVAGKNKDGISFIENKGQVCDQNYNSNPNVLFSGSDGKLVFHIKNNGISYQLNKTEKLENNFVAKDSIALFSKTKQHIYRVDVNWLNSNTTFKLMTEGQQSSYSNYYFPWCGVSGAIDVKSYKGIILKDIYAGINLHYYHTNGNLKYDYIVAPGANYKCIQLEIKGAEIIQKQDGGLILITPLGKIEEGAPVVYQNGKKLKAKWIVQNNILSFEVKNYDPKHELIIDPLTRFWGTFYGDIDYEIGNSVSSDPSANVYMTGSTLNSSGITMATVGSHQAIIGGQYDAYLVKFDPQGSRLWATYYGGIGDEAGYSCPTFSNNVVYLAGVSNSTAGISTIACYQPLCAGARDAMLVKFNASGIRQWATYFGGPSGDMVRCACVDGAGNIFMGGETFSTAGISSFGCHQQTFGWGFTDACFVKFDQNGNKLWSTYYGGPGDDVCYSCDVDQTGNAYFAGKTSSSTSSVICTAAGHQVVYSGSTDAFLVKFNSNGVRQWGTYYGGTGSDASAACKVDASKNVYLSGSTNSGLPLNCIATPGSYQPNYVFNNDGFLAKFDSTGLRKWATYYGDVSGDDPTCIDIDASKNILLVGNVTSGATTLSTPGSYQPNYGGGFADGFMALFDSVGTRLWGSYYGDNSNQNIFSCDISNFGDIYIAGFTATSTVNNVLASSNAHQTTHGGSWDAFLARFRDCPIIGLNANSNSPICSFSNLNLNSNVTTTLPITYNWEGPNSFTSTAQNPNIFTAQTANSGIYTITCNYNGCNEIVTINAIVNPLPNLNPVSSSSVMCIGSSATLSASGAASYSWNAIAGSSSIVVSPTATSNYTVTGITSNSCINSAIITQSVVSCTSLNEFDLSTNYILFPNPCKDKLWIQLDSKTTITISDLLGRKMYMMELYKGMNEINVSEFPKGLYLVGILNHSEQVIYKIIKE